MRPTHISAPILLTALFFIFLTSCWQEQHHGITPSTLPNYPVMGRVLNSADGTPVKGASVSLYTILDTVVVTTDSVGSFYFENIQGGKSYSLSVEKDYYQSYFGSAYLGYDTLEVDDIILGKIYYHIDIYDPALWTSFSPQGVVWLGSNLWSADSMSKTIFAHNYDSYMTVAEKYTLPYYTIPKGEFYIAPLGLERYRNSMVTYDDHLKTIYELILTAGDTALIQRSYRLPEEITSSNDIWDFTYDGHRMWSCSPGSYKNFHILPNISQDDVIYRHNGDLSVATAYNTSDIDDGIINPTGIAWDDSIQGFWLNSRGNHRLYMLDEDLQVLGYYIFEESIWPWTPYQICKGTGYIWGCFRDSWAGINSVGGPTQYIYKFGKHRP